MNGNSVYLGHGFHLDGLRRGGSVTGGGNTPERYPLFRGADVDSGTEGVDYELKDVNTTEYADFSGNEAYGALKAFSMDHYGVYPGTITYTDCSSWATAFESWFIYGADGSASVINPVVRRSVFTAFGPNSMGKTVLRLSGGDIQTITGVGLEWIGGNSALDGFPANHLIVEDTLIAAPQPVVVNLSDPATHGPPDRVLPAKIWTLTNCLLINTDAGANLITMVPKQPGTTHSDNPMTFEQVFLEDFQQSSGDNFQLFWNEQAASASAPGPSAASGYACPVDGLTNQQCFDTYGRAFGGELMDAGAVTETWLAGGKALAAVPSNTLKTNLAAYYKHDEASGNLLDSHSTHDGIAPGSEPTSTTGKILGGRQYTAASSQNYVVDGSGGEFVTSISGNPFGMCCWLYFDSFPAFAQVISRTSGNGYELRLNAAGALQFLAAFPLDGSANVISTVSLSTGTWYFVVAWYDNILNKMRISVNNAASDDVTPSVAPIINGTFDLAVGARTNNSLYFNGRMDEMAIWMDRFPTASEQTLIYGGGSGFAFSNWH
jgi:hypothetical protein